MRGTTRITAQIAAGVTEVTQLEEKAMKTKFVITCLICGMLVGSAVALAQDSDTDRSQPKAFVKDSAITTKIKTKLAAEHITSLGRIHVDTDKDGVVWLSGSARTQEAIDKAVSIARETEGVKDVQSHIKIKKDD
jgi:hyperosmotically inducible protein